MMREGFTTGSAATAAACNTVNQATVAVARLVRLAKKQAQVFAGGPVIMHLFHTDGRERAIA